MFWEGYITDIYIFVYSTRTKGMWNGIEGKACELGYENCIMKNNMYGTLITVKLEGQKGMKSA